jgi:hypothetical protein
VVTHTALPLPYIPCRFRHKAFRGIGHPALAMLFWGEGQVAGLLQSMHTIVYKRRPNFVREIQVPTELRLPWSHLVIKQYGWRGSQHFLFSPLKRSKARKAYRTACYLLAHGLPTPLPLGAFEMRRYGFLQDNCYVTEALTNFMTLRKYCTSMPDGPGGMAEVLRLAAVYTRRMHDSGLWHRDMSLGNFLVAGPPGRRQLYLVDLNRARRLGYLPAWMRALDLARMEWQTWRPQFFALYCDGRFAIHRMLQIAHLYTRWRAWRRRVLQRLNPLRVRLGLK